jgi:ribosomal protein S18 acetylase RimI-like enzyme
MPKFVTATPEQYDQFLQMMWEDSQEYLPNAMRVMQMTWDEYAQIFRTRGEVRAIYQDADLAGFYWVEERGDTLHLHGLILKAKFQGQGIGTSVLTMLAESYASKMNIIELGVYQANSGAIKLYEKMGYKITRSLDNLHFYIMQKSLTSQSVS